MRVEVEVPVIGWGHAKTGHAYKNIFASVPRVYEIPEYDVSEVPAVLAYHETDPNGRTRRSEYFGVGGKLYRDRMVSANDATATAFHYQRYGRVPHPFFSAVSDRYDKAIHLLRKESDLLAPKKMIPAEFGEHVVKGSGDVPFRIPTFQELSLKSYNEKAVEEQVVEFSKRMERMIVVGGNLLVEEQEPIIRIDGNMGWLGKHEGGVHVRPELSGLLNFDAWYGKNPLAFVSFADFEALDERVAALTARIGGSVEFEARISSVEVDDARYLRASGEGATLMAVADLLRRAFVENLTVTAGDSDYQRRNTQKNLLGTDPAVLASVQRLVISLFVAHETDVPAELESAVASIVEIHARNDLTTSFKSRTLLEYASDVLQLWQDREIGFDLGVGKSSFRA